MSHYTGFASDNEVSQCGGVAHMQAYSFCAIRLVGTTLPHSEDNAHTLQYTNGNNKVSSSDCSNTFQAVTALTVHMPIVLPFHSTSNKHLTQAMAPQATDSFSNNSKFRSSIIYQLCIVCCTCSRMQSGTRQKSFSRTVCIDTDRRQCRRGSNTAGV